MTTNNKLFKDAIVSLIGIGGLIFFDDNGGEIYHHAKLMDLTKNMLGRDLTTEEKIIVSVYVDYYPDWLTYKLSAEQEATLFELNKLVKEQGKYNVSLEEMLECIQ